MLKRYLPLLFLGLLLAMPALAAEGLPVDKGLGLQTPVSPVAEKVSAFHDLLLYIITAIVIFVTALLIWVCFRYSAKRNPNPSKVAHNTLIEVIWTAVPVLILVAIAIPSIKMLYYVGETPDPELTVKLTGHQWYWQYTYPDNGDIDFDSNMIVEKDLTPEQIKGGLRLLAVDNPLVLPVDTNIRLLVTSADVIHALAMPSMGLKKDAVPGQLNETWTRIEREGEYYGQCSEICGPAHAFMPIAIHAVSKEAYADWVKSKGGTIPGEKTAALTSAPAAPSAAAKQE